MLDPTTIARLKACQPGDAIEINNGKFEIISRWDSIDTSALAKAKEVRSEGIELELRDADSSTCSLLVLDVDVEYERTQILSGPAPMNSNPDVVFVQDAEAGKTSKYAIRRSPKTPAVLRLMKGGKEIKIRSVSIV